MEEGKLGEYHPNDGHLVLTVDGLVQLPPSLRQVLIRELKRLKV